MEIKLALETLYLKGYLKYEYNPLRNYKTSVDLYLVNDEFIVPKNCAVNLKNGRILRNKGTNNEEKWVDDFGNIVSSDYYIKVPNNENPNIRLYAKEGALIDLNTKDLNFDLEHPVDITVLPSYDGSVNLILNDGKNIPRLINSRFSVRLKNTYEIVDRIGENDSNIYSSDNFDKDSSLYFQYGSNPLITFSGYTEGTLSVGQYYFCITYCDSDDNESDYVVESGLIPVFKGVHKLSSSMDGGIKNENSNKGIRLSIDNLDKSFNYIKVYYIRYFADYLQNRVYEGKKLLLRFPVNSNFLDILITGSELTEDIDPNILNISRFNPKNVLTQALCKNMLFFGNIVKNSDNYKELSDCALRILPTLSTSSSISSLSDNYVSSDYSYYNSFNIYNKTGYSNKEFYRFGVVFIYNNGTLSNVYNTSGYTLTNEQKISYKEGIWLNETEGVLLRRNYIKIDDFGWVINPSEYINNIQLEVNSRGVCKIDTTGETFSSVYGILFNVPNEVIKHLLEDLGVRGLFFVRLKRIPSVIALMYLLPMDETLQAPAIPLGENILSESFIDNLGFLNLDYNSRLVLFNKSSNLRSYAGICPDFLLNLPYYNQIFNNSEFYILKVCLGKLNRSGRHYNNNYNEIFNYNNPKIKVLICSVTEAVPTVALHNKTYRLNIGEASEAFRFRSIGEDRTSYNAGAGNDDSAYKVTNISRGIYSPYLAIYSDTPLEVSGLYNIYQVELRPLKENYQIRMDSKEPFYAISNRLNFKNLNKGEDSKNIVCYRGDCYSNLFTWRMNRNFNDPALPSNDDIIDIYTWAKYYMGNYIPSLNEGFDRDFAKIIRSDVNAVKLGSWITFKLKSPINYALRSQDHSYVSEEATMLHPRSFYPRNDGMENGSFKMPDSYLYNDAYRASLGYKTYFTLLDINYIKDTFSNRILYSAIAIQDSFKNNYRESLSTYFRDYSSEYGGITKLVEFNGNLLVIFEHGIGLATINERVLASDGGEGNPVFINTLNVLPEELTIFSDTYGTQWTESVVKSEIGYVYGVDTVAKKIWRVSNKGFEILSDFKVNKFLVENISLKEEETSPIIGLKNVKTHYNNYKKDIMFTFYDDIYQDEEKVWNLCYNELLGQFVTFYSWVPSYSENIDTQFFTFNRNTSKILSLLEKSNYNIPENLGILLDSPIFKSDYRCTLHYRGFEGLYKTEIENEDGTYSSKTGFFTKELNNNITFTLEKDHWGNHNLFEIKKINNTTNILLVKSNKPRKLFKDKIDKYKYIILVISAQVGLVSLGSQTVALTTEEVIKQNIENPGKCLTTDFYLHGKAGIFNVVEDLYPTYWYGEYHPFEFEFVVNDKIEWQKVFNNLIIISNKAEPESFHFEVEGDNYEFSSDKRTMYFRLEITKNLYLNLGSDILFDREYMDCSADKYTLELYYRKLDDEYTEQYYNKGIPSDRVYPIESLGLVQQVKSSIFPLYYKRTDTYNEIYDSYSQWDGNPKYDYKNLSGSEIIWNRDLNLFNVVTHIKNNPIDKVGILRGNSLYKEGKWNIQIPSIIFMLKNEPEWDLGKLPIVLNSDYIPTDIETNTITPSNIPKGCNMSDIKLESWGYRKETRIRDKWIKIRVRYSGKNLAIIHSIVTLYNISYS